MAECTLFPELGFHSHTLLQRFPYVGCLCAFRRGTDAVDRRCEERECREEQMLRVSFPGARMTFTVAPARDASPFFSRDVAVRRLLRSRDGCAKWRWMHYCSSGAVQRWRCCCWCILRSRSSCCNGSCLFSVAAGPIWCAMEDGDGCVVNGGATNSWWLNTVWRRCILECYSHSSSPMKAWWCGVAGHVLLLEKIEDGMEDGGGWNGCVFSASKLVQWKMTELWWPESLQQLPARVATASMVMVGEEKKLGLGFHFERWWRGKLWLVNLVSGALWRVSSCGWTDLECEDCHMA